MSNITNFWVRKTILFSININTEREKHSKIRIDFRKRAERSEEINFYLVYYLFKREPHRIVNVDLDLPMKLEIPKTSQEKYKLGITQRCWRSVSSTTQIK